MAFPKKQKSTYYGEWRPVEYPNKLLTIYPSHSQIVQEDTH